jgi:hypothetical protein
LWLLASLQAIKVVLVVLKVVLQVLIAHQAKHPAKYQAKHKAKYQAKYVKPANAMDHCWFGFCQTNSQLRECAFSG